MVKKMKQETYTIIANPGSNANTEINISWHTDIKYLKSKLIYTIATDTSWVNATICSGTYYLNDIFDGNYSITKDRIDYYEQATFLHYHYEIKDLIPNTLYMYKVGEVTLSDVHYFKTGSIDFSFAWVSDFHAYLPIPSRLRLAFDTTQKVIEKEKGIDFIFCGGDAIAWGGSYSFWKDMYSEDLVKNYMWVNILGNHDYMSRANLKNTSAYFRDCNYFPRNGYNGQEGVCYHFIYGDVLFIILNNEAMGFKEEHEEITKTREWLINILQNNTSQYIFVCQHYEWFQGITGASRIWGNLRFKDIFDEYRVDVAIGNNNHIYVRSKSIYKDKPSNNVNYGTTYIQSPSADNERGQVINELQYNQDLIASRFSEGGKTIGVLTCHCNSERIIFKLYNREIEIIDQVIIYPRRKGLQ